MIERARTQGPGLAKIRAPQLIGRRRVDLVSVREGPWRAALDRADVVSEGRSDRDGDGLVYFGSTSILFKLLEAGGDLRAEDVATIAAALRVDPHVRLRMIRVAHREATMRAGATLGPVSADLTILATARGVLVTIEVSAKLRRSRTNIMHR